MPAESPLRDGDATGFGLIETLRWEPEHGFLRLERHLERLGNSAQTLGFRHDPGDATKALSRAVADAAGPLRLRLQLSRDGNVNVAAQPFAPLPAGTIWTLRLADTRLDATDPLLRHKTTRRRAYELARAQYTADQANEVLLANERGELCEGTIASLFADFGNSVLATPRLDCGLLAGILRAEMLDEGKATEAVFSYDDLKSARAIFVGNSLRGLIPARLA